MALVATGTAAAVAAVAVVAVAASGSHSRPPSGLPASASPLRSRSALPPAPPPAIIYTTTSSVVLRDGAGPPRVLGTFGQSAEFGYAPAVAWSPDGQQVAWLADGTLNLASVKGGPTRHWACSGCYNVAFQGDQVVTEPAAATGSDQTAAAAQLLVLPADGSAPVTESITGIPTGQIDTDFRLMGDSPAGTPVVAFGDAGGSDAGGEQQLYRVGQAGHATPYGEAPAARPIYGGLGQFATDQSGDLASLTTFSNFGACGGVEVAYVVNSSTGAVTVPATPSGGGREGFWVEGLWFDPAGTAYASFVPNLTNCTTSSPPGALQPPNAIPIVCKLVGGRWVRTSGGALRASYAPGGWLAEQLGPASAGALDYSAAYSLVISHGGTAVTVPGVSAFAWAP